MSEKLQRLYLRDNYIKFNAPSAKSMSRVVRDVQYIHDPSTSKLGRSFRGLFWGNFDLRARPHGKAYALFGASINCDDIDSEVTVMMNRLKLPGQAAGWSALQLYREKAGGLRLPHLDAVDPSMDAGHKAIERRFALHGEARTDAATSVFRYGGGLSIYSAGEGMPSNVRAYNKEGQSLPDILGVIKTGYDELYPGTNTSAAVAGIVGAGNLEEFAEVWKEAAAQHEPIIAARTLLESDVFLANQ